MKMNVCIFSVMSICVSEEVLAGLLVLALTGTWCLRQQQQQQQQQQQSGSNNSVSGDTDVRSVAATGAGEGTQHQAIHIHNQVHRSQQHLLRKEGEQQEEDISVSTEVMRRRSTSPTSPECRSSQLQRYQQPPPSLPASSASVRTVVQARQAVARNSSRSHLHQEFETLPQELLPTESSSYENEAAVSSLEHQEAEVLQDEQDEEEGLPPPSTRTKQPVLSQDGSEPLPPEPSDEHSPQQVLP